MLEKYLIHFLNFRGILLLLTSSQIKTAGFSLWGRCRWKVLKLCALQVPVCTTFKTLYIIQHLGATAASLATIKFPNYSFSRPSIIAACILQKCSVLSALIALSPNSYSIKGYCAAGHWKTFHRAHRSNYEFFILSGLKSQRHKAALSPCAKPEQCEWKLFTTRDVSI